MTMSWSATYGWLLTRPRPADLLKSIVLLCVLALSSNTLETLRYLQDALDDLVRSDIPIRAAYVKPTNQQNLSPDSQCLVHLPLMVNASKTLKSSSVLQHPSSKHCGKLRRNWSGYTVQSALAREIEENQSNCSWPVATFHVDNDSGFGSHLYLWSQAICNAHELGYRVQSFNPNWLWLDQSYCDSFLARKSPFLCYFPTIEYNCGIDETLLSSTNVTDPRQVKRRCSRMAQDKGFLAAFRTASVEYIFRQVSSIVVREAERQIGLLFSDGNAPDDLITVHIRWGDKFWEMDLAPIAEYIEAVSTMLKIQGRGDNSTANIYLATEDPKAAMEFMAAVPTGWKVYVDRTVVELNNFRPVKGNRASWTTRNTNGRAGLVALGSLLVAMESNYFVLTTASNWSRLMNELRKSVLDSKCGNCTRLIDLRPGQW
jgi:hypothetical protein